MILDYGPELVLKSTGDWSNHKYGNRTVLKEHTGIFGLGTAGNLGLGMGLAGLWVEYLLQTKLYLCPHLWT